MQDPGLTDNKLVFHLNEYLNNENLSHRRRKNFAPKELNIIITMVEENAELIYNRVNRNPKFLSKQEFWHTVTTVVNENCHFAAKRDVKEVRRKWVTFQSEVKSKAREGTHLLNQHEARVWDLIQKNSQSLPETGADQMGDVSRLTMLPKAGEQVETPLLAPSQCASPASSLSSTTSQPTVTETNGTVTETELLMNICSQVMGLSQGEITAQTVKDMIKPAPITSTSATFTSTSSTTPVRNVVSVQPSVNHHTPPKRPRTIEHTPLNTDSTPTQDNSALVDYLQQLVDQQRRSNRIAEERLLIEKQRKDIETEKLQIEKARYEIEKERLCQEIISRKKSL